MRVLVFALISAFCCATTTRAHATVSVRLPTGALVSGFVETTDAGGAVNKFLGIPYAEPPVDQKRWTQSTVKALTNDINATEYRDTCIEDPVVDVASSSFQNEDCLYLNIFTPAGSTSQSKLPVMVWVHGGSFTFGSGNEYDGASLIRASTQGLIVVTFNYRLGALGFFSSQEVLAQGDGANFGLRDQETAFLWVKKYITAFGGDPEVVTAFGESTGAVSLAYHLVAHDGHQRLFERAILQSGGMMSAQYIATTSVQARQSKELAAAVGCNSSPVLDCLRKVSAREIVIAARSFNHFPTVDHVYIQQPPFTSLIAGKLSRVPTIIGTNTDDGWSLSNSGADASQFDVFVRESFPRLTDTERERLVALYPASAFASAHHRTAEMISDTYFVCAGEIISDLLALTVSDTYRYRFNYPSIMQGFPLTLHTKDLDYVFDRKYNLPNNTDARTVVSHFQTFWTNFAVSGSPNRASVTQCNARFWPRYDVITKEQILLQPTLAVEAHSAYMLGHSARCQFWYDVEARVTAFVSVSA